MLIWFTQDSDKWLGTHIYMKVHLQVLPGKPMTLFKDHRKYKNTYLFIYGDTWVDKLKNYFSVSKLCCISYMIRFVVKEGEKIMKGSVHEDDFL